MGRISQNSITYEDTWITPFVLNDPSPDWHIIGYRKQKLGRTLINSQANRLLSDIHQFNDYLNLVHADRASHGLVAKFIIDQINQPDDDHNAFINAVTAFECFFESMPWPESDTDSVTYEQVLQVINICEDEHAGDQP